MPVEPLTTEQLAALLPELKSKLEAMTPGPWRPSEGRAAAYALGANAFGNPRPELVFGGADDADRDGLVALRNAAPALLATVEAQAERVRDLEAGLREATKDGCALVYGGRPSGWTCLDNQRNARADMARIASGEPRVPGEMYSSEYGARLASGAELCSSCRLTALLTAPQEPRP